MATHKGAAMPQLGIGPERTLSRDKLQSSESANCAANENTIQYPFGTFSEQPNRKKKIRSRRISKRCSSMSLAYSLAELDKALKEVLEQENESLQLDSQGESLYTLAIPDPNKERTNIQGEEGTSRSKPRRNGCGIPWRWSKKHKRHLRGQIKDFTGRKSSSLNTRTARKIFGTQVSSDGESLSSDEYSIEEAEPTSYEIMDLSFNSAPVEGQCYFPHFTHEANHHGSKQEGENERYHRTKESSTCRSLSLKYQPKLFQDIIGHEITVQALENAIGKKKVAPLYLFHGSRGTGKTSTARIFAMASNCEIASANKPCWSCRGCSRSLYIAELCSGSRRTGFERIRTLIQSTAFSQTVPGYKVFIIEESHTLTDEAWYELLSMVQRVPKSVVFVMITEDASMVPRVVSSRCHKFCFTKLRDQDIASKLTRIVTLENIRIDGEALKLITVKADGSLRDAENILDQLSLLGSRITNAMVQQLVCAPLYNLIPLIMHCNCIHQLLTVINLQVGLVPDSKLTELLNMALSGDTARTVCCTRELIGSGVEPVALISQLASLITDILAGKSATTTPSKDELLLRSQSLTKNRPERLCQALTILTETEKQLRSSTEHATWVVAALLQLAPPVSDSHSTNVVLPKGIISTGNKSTNGARPAPSVTNWKTFTEYTDERTHFSVGNLEKLDVKVNDIDATAISGDNGTKSGIGCLAMVEMKPNLAQMRNMEEVWNNIVERIQNKYLKEFLNQNGKLMSLTVSKANAIVHLMFKTPEDKLTAETSEATISKAFEAALGCPVTVTMSLEPSEFSIFRTSVPLTDEQLGHTKQRQHRRFNSKTEEQQNTNAREVVLNHSRSSKTTGTSEMLLRSTSSRESVKKVQVRDILSEEHERRDGHHRHSQDFSGSLLQRNRQDRALKDQDPKDRALDMITMNTNTQLKRRSLGMLSLTSIQQADASIEPYSQDLMFENKNQDITLLKRRTSNLQADSPKTRDHQQHRACL
ncbi:hypothetical protein AMTR_s00022p00099080 [Amborella trichopoda]|uniref:DNA polymerase III gamma subunit domain-containing protein n=2 Tax=Amborella trichopoda TaxID=13333 RepID=W1PUG8_AMBTC|nr:hypothetical protein AMTR_s00022p00099080 [Amborella trichopoda]